MSSEDHLSLATNSAVLAMLKKRGGQPETVRFSDYVIKINRKGKEQTRVLLITDKACYNLMPSNYGKCKRRISLDVMVGITMSTASDEFVFHVPDEYDYRFKSGKKQHIVELLRSLTAERSDGLGVRKMGKASLDGEAMTKTEAKLQTREWRAKRRQELMNIVHDSDDEDKKADVAALSAEELMPGSERVALADFELLKVLGRGAFGKVMQVRKKDTGVVYAMKILKKSYIIKKNQVEHTVAERRILRQLQHPFLMTLRFAFQSPQKLYLVLDYYRGGELFFHLKKQRRFAEDVARIYVLEVGLALGHLHAMGIVYRDLKPENILLDDNGHVCLTDFGLAKSLDPDDTAHTFCGTPEYLAPEIVGGHGHTKSVDWWSLGILLYELTVGIPPFYSQNVNEMYNKITNGVLRFPPFLSDECKSLIVALLNRDPSKRLGSTSDVDELTSHPFFSSLSLEAVLRKEIDVAYKPQVKGATDAQYFDEVFTSEPVVDSHVPDSELPGGGEFDGFTFAPAGAPIAE